MALPKKILKNYNDLVFLLLHGTESMNVKNATREWSQIHLQFNSIELDFSAWQSIGHLRNRGRN